ncbi:MAG: efflux RND transporter periplasmic adaptor subunit [Candidatus Cyclobacteriaceae bacterium M3_2C_046]
MKKIKKIIGILVVVALVAWVVFTLINNKKEMDQELQAILDYSYTTPVQVVSARYQPTEYVLIENGITQADQEVEVMAETQGEITSLMVKVGQKVIAGKVLATVEKKVLLDQLALAEVNLKNAENDLKRFQALVKGDAVTQQQVEAMELKYQDAKTSLSQLQEQLAHKTIKAPVSGVISSKSIEQGSFVTPGMSIMNISTQSAMNFVIWVAEQDLHQIKEGLAAEVKLDVFSDRILKGIVSEISVKPDLSGRYSVAVQIPNPDYELTSGLSGMAHFSFPSKAEHIVLPRKVLVGSVQNASVYVVNGDSVQLKPVTVASMNARDIAVLQGLDQNEQVVVSGQINLQNGTKVNIIN